MSVVLDRDEARVTFDRFDLDAYRTFLRCKAIPEKRVSMNGRSGVYIVATPRRFASMLDPLLKSEAAELRPLAPHLFDYQAFIVERALEAKRYAIWADTGLGKTAMFLEFARQVVLRTQAKVLIISPLQIISQTREEAHRFYADVDGDGVVLTRLDSRAALARWCQEPGPGIAITNYEKLIEGVLNELRHLAGLILDESSILKSGGGVIKWNLIKSARGIEYKLSCTATPAPNDTMEYASQAAFLEKLRNEGEILWTYFTRDKNGTWSVKPHAREAFYAFMATWSIYLRDPSHYGWADILASLPEPEVIEHVIPLGDKQRRIMHELQVEGGTGMFNHERMGVRERSKSMQLARGFLYQGSPRQAIRIPSQKPHRVAEIVEQEVQAGRQVLVWTTFDEESEILRGLLHAWGDGVAEVLTGDTPADEREVLIAEFKANVYPVLISKPQLLGYGLNFQNCTAMVFSGFDDSFERMYQSVRRAYRYGQTQVVRVHLPYVAELEGMVFENLRAKEARFMAEAGEQEAAYLVAMRALGAIA